MIGLKQVCCLISAVFFFSGCGDDKNPVSSQSESKIITPLANSLSSDFTVISFNIAKTRDNSKYLSGVGEIQYTGTTSLKFVKIFVTFKSSSGSVIYKDSTYINNITTTNYGSSTPIYTNTFVSPSSPKGYYNFIGEASFSVASIAKVEFAFEGKPFEAKDPVSKVTLSGNPYESNGMLHQNITNNGNESVNAESCLFIFQNSSGVSYDWTYPTVYKKQGTGYTENDIIDADASGRLSCSIPTSDIETQPLSIKQTLLNWNAATILAKRLLSDITDTDAKLKAYRNSMDDAIDKLRKQ